MDDGMVYVHGVWMMACMGMYDDMYDGMNALLWCGDMYACVGACVASYL
jgi:hypothetical protein